MKSLVFTIKIVMENENRKAGDGEGVLGQHDFGSVVARAVLEQYSQIGQRGKPRENEWTVLAAFVISETGYPPTY
jgi:hypothetical protein